MFVEEIVTSGETKPNTNEACSVPTCPDVTNIYMPCCNYSIELSNWICKIWIQVGGGDESKTEKKKELHFFLSDGDETVHWSTTAVCVCVRSQGPVLNAACQLAQWMPQPPLPAPSLLPSGHSSGHAHGCYSPAWLNASVPQNKGAECPL